MRGQGREGADLRQVQRSAVSNSAEQTNIDRDIPFRQKRRPGLLCCGCTLVTATFSSHVAAEPLQTHCQTQQKDFCRTQSDERVLAFNEEARVILNPDYEREKWRRKSPMNGLTHPQKMHLFFGESIRLKAGEKSTAEECRTKTFAITPHDPPVPHQSCSMLVQSAKRVYFISKEGVHDLRRFRTANKRELNHSASDTRESREAMIDMFKLDSKSPDI